MVEPVQPPPEDFRDMRAVEQARVDARAGVVLLAVYFVDAAFLAGFAGTGQASWWVPALFVFLGITVPGGFALAVARAGQMRLKESNAVLVQAVIALLNTLGVAWTNPRVAMLMLLTVVVIIPTAALRLSPRRLLVLSVLAALGCAAVVDRHNGQLTVPVASGVQQLLTGLFFLWTLIKGASVNLAGMSMRLSLDASHAKLADALARVEDLAESDELTGLPNRRRILDVLAQAREEQSRGGKNYGVAMLDVDHFKQINDTFGHSLGDEVLRVIASVLRKTTRDGDAVGRIGGEEFLLVLSGTSAIPDAQIAAERVRSALERHDWAKLKPQLRVTASIGLAIGELGETAERVLCRADQGLYQAKRAGRNRVAYVDRGTACEEQS
jgi:diguanylate cyclase